MTIASEISRLQTAKADIKSSIEAKGVTVPSNAKLDTYDDYVAQIVSGSSYKSYSELIEMDINNMLNELNSDAEGYFDNLTANNNMYQDLYLGTNGLYEDGDNIIIYAYGEWVTTTKESIMYKIIADSNGNLYVPISGYNRSGSTYAPYNWKISVNNGQYTIYSGTGSSGGKITLSGYTAGETYIITIKPVKEEYGWALAYGWNFVTERTQLIGVMYDGSYIGYCADIENTGNYYKAYQYKDCTSLKYVVNDELFLDKAKYIGDHFKSYRCSGCTNLEHSVKENVNPISVGTLFRRYQYQQCSKLSTPAEEHIGNQITTMGGGFRYGQYYQSGVTFAPEEDFPDSVTTTDNNFRAWQFGGCSNLSEIKGRKDKSIGGSSYRDSQFRNSNKSKTITVIGGVGYASKDNNTISNSSVTSVYVQNKYLQDFVNATTNPRTYIDDNKYVGYNPSGLKTYEQICTMATNELFRWNDTIKELNKHASDYFYLFNKDNHMGASPDGIVIDGQSGTIRSGVYCLKDQSGLIIRYESNPGSVTCSNPYYIAYYNGERRNDMHGNCLQ